MNNKRNKMPALLVFLMAGLCLISSDVGAQIPGISGPTFNLSARVDCIYGGDGLGILIWGYADGANRAQYPGPTLLVNEDQTVVIHLTNIDIPEPVSIVFPGQVGVGATGGAAGVITQEAAIGQTVTYTFTAAEPGTYLYNSGSHADLQVEMGLFGALIIRPSMGPQYAYNDAQSYFDVEHLFLMSEVDLRIHDAIAFGQPYDTSTFFPVYWFVNGRNAPDTMDENAVPWLPTQPYNCMPMMMPGQKLLCRFIGAGRQSHPFHTHGNHFAIIARDGRLMSSAPGSGVDLMEKAFSVGTAPGQTYDAIFEWTGEKLGWDIYGHQQDRDEPPTGNFPGPEDIDHNGDGMFDDVMMEMHEYEPDHGKPFPVDLPQNQDLTFGEMYNGSPFLGGEGMMPPGQGGFNPMGAFVYMWHSHTEKELTNNDIFPGGLLTHLMIMPHMMP